MKKASNMRLIPLGKKNLISLILIIGIAISVVVFLPQILELFEKPYFIIIKNNEDLELWSSSGDGTMENPYSIEGHHIRVPRNDPDDFFVPCIPESSVISIRNVTKSFIIQNNILEVKGGCEGQNIIRISDISIPFVIRNNIFRGGLYASSFKLSNINGYNSVISNNRIYGAGSYLVNVHNVTIINNQFYTKGFAFGAHASQSSRISLIHNYFYLYSVNVRECSEMLLHDNTFENDEMYSGWNLATITETDSCTITNNTFIKGGLRLKSFDLYYPSAIVSGNIINGKPYGLFYNQSNVIIDGTTKYGQIKLVRCKFSTITDQVISDTSQPILIENCADTIVATSIISYSNWAGVLIKNSTNTSVLDCVLEGHQSGVRGENSHGIFVKRNLFKSLIFGIRLDDCTILIEDNNVFEDVDMEVRSF